MTLKQENVKTVQIIQLQLLGKGLDDQYYKTLIIEYLKQYTKANRKEIDRLLWDKLPDSLSEVQKKNKIANLLTSMKNKNLIEKDSDNQQKSNWVLK